MVETTAPLVGAGPLFDADAALEARLREAFPPAKFEHQVVPARLDKNAWLRLTKRLPFVGRGWTGWAAEKDAGRVFRGPATWNVFLANYNPRPEALPRGDARGPGLFGMAQMAAAVLHGWTVPGLGTWTVGNVGSSYSDEWGDEGTGLVMLAASLTLNLASYGALDALPDFLRLGAEWPHPPLDADLHTVRTP